MQKGSEVSRGQQQNPSLPLSQMNSSVGVKYSELHQREPNPHCTQEYGFILKTILGITVRVLGIAEISALENMLSEEGDI